jgi:hypothetical protein
VTAGQTSSTASFTLVPDSTPPAVTVLCNGTTCATTGYPKAVLVTFNATDGTGSGVDSIRYTTNGTDPTADNGTDYTAALNIQNLTHLKVVAYDKAGNASTPLAVTINSLANRLTFAAPVRITVRAKGAFLLAHVVANKRASVAATLSGRGLKTPMRWRFILQSGSSVVQLRLPKVIKRPGTYKVTWAVTAGTTKTSRSSSVVLR